MTGLQRQTPKTRGNTACIFFDSRCIALGIEKPGDAALVPAAKVAIKIHSVISRDFNRAHFSLVALQVAVSRLARPSPHRGRGAEGAAASPRDSAHRYGQER